MAAAATNSNGPLFAHDAAVQGWPFWWDDVAWPSLEGEPPAAVDILVIGAGYTGRPLRLRLMIAVPMLR